MKFYLCSLPLCLLSVFALFACGDGQFQAVDRLPVNRFHDPKQFQLSQPRFGQRPQMPNQGPMQIPQMPNQGPMHRPLMPKTRLMLRPNQMPMSRPNQKPMLRSILRPNQMPNQMPKQRPMPRPNQMPNQMPNQRPMPRSNQMPNQRPMPRPNQMPNQRPMPRPNQMPNQRPMPRPNQMPNQRPMSRSNQMPNQMPMQRSVQRDFYRPGIQNNQGKCLLKGHLYNIGTKMISDCQLCTCLQGDKVQCIPLNCKHCNMYPTLRSNPCCIQRCSVIGMPVEFQFEEGVADEGEKLVTAKPPEASDSSEKPL